MRNAARSTLALGLAALLAACGSSDNDPGPGGVSVGEARALDEAAEMLDQQRLPAEALTEPDESAAADSGVEAEASAEPAE